MAYSIVFVLAWAIWTYASAGHRLVRPDLDARLIAGGRRMGIAYVVVFVVPIIMAFLSPLISFILYGVVVLGFVAATVGGRWDTVMLLSRGKSAIE